MFFHNNTMPLHKATKMLYFPKSHDNAQKFFVPSRPTHAKRWTLTYGLDMCVPRLVIRCAKYAPLPDVDVAPPSSSPPPSPTSSPPRPKRPRPRPLSFPPFPTFKANSSLSVPTLKPYGPGSYVRTPLSARNPGFESFRDDHGIKFTAKRHPVAALLIRMRLLEDVDAEQLKLRNRVGKFVKRKGLGLKKWAKKGWRKKE
jgi:hypothetical protein